MKGKLFKELYSNPTRNLNNIIRYSGVYCIKPETDGDHVIDMMSICHKISDLIFENYNIRLNLKDLIYRCYAHDVDEVLTGDVQRGLKYYNETIHKEIDNISLELLNKNYKKGFVDDVRSAKDINDPCGVIVKIADTIQSSLKIYEECKLSNFHFLRIAKEHSEFLKDLKKRIECTGFVFTPLLIEIIEDFIKIIDLEIHINNKNF